MSEVRNTSEFWPDEGPDLARVAQHYSEEALAMARENEALDRGESVPVSRIENHRGHLEFHGWVATPGVSPNWEARTRHMAEHNRVLEEIQTEPIDACKAKLAEATE